MMLWRCFLVRILSRVRIGLFAINMVINEPSRSRYPQWAAHKTMSWRLIPLVY
jgi:hypothetical protein